jgi:hypothetical protein
MRLAPHSRSCAAQRSAGGRLAAAASRVHAHRCIAALERHHAAAGQPGSRGRAHRSRTRALDDSPRVSKIVDDGEYLDIEIDEDELDAIIAEVRPLPLHGAWRGTRPLEHCSSPVRLAERRMHRQPTSCARRTRS